MRVPPRLKDHMRNMIVSRIKCGPYWTNIPDHEERSLCSFCKKEESIDILESEQHLWLECSHNGQHSAWATAKLIWEKSTERPWPNLSLGLIRGSAAISFEDDENKDSERLRILISMTIWAIWKSRNKKSINDQDVAPNEASTTLRELIRDLMRKGWNATRFIKDGRRTIRRRAVRSLWADGHLVVFDPKTGPTVDLF